MNLYRRSELAVIFLKEILNVEIAPATFMLRVWFVLWGCNFCILLYSFSKTQRSRKSMNLAFSVDMMEMNVICCSVGPHFSIEFF